MKTLSARKKFYREKVYHEVEAFIDHYGTNHILFGTLTLRGEYPLERICRMWTRFANRIGPIVLAYYAVLDNSNRHTPHVHFLLAVEEDVTHGINMEALGKLYMIQKYERAHGLIPHQRTQKQQVKALIGDNEALRHYRARVRHFKELAGFAPIFDLAPIYSKPAAIAGYFRKAYTQAALRKSKRPGQRRRRIVYVSRNLPEGIRKKPGSFTRLTPQGAAYRAAQTAAARAFGLPIGDPRVFYRFFQTRQPSDWSGAVWEFVNSTPRRKGQPYSVQAARRFFEDRFAICNLAIPIVRVPARPDGQAKSTIGTNQ